MFKSTTSRSFKLSIFCLLLLLLFTLSLCLAESQKPQQEEEEIIDRETSLTKTPPNGTIQLGASTTSKLAPNEQILADDDDDMEDYDMDDFAILGMNGY
ncbi:hypothetical protein C9374_005919 [Naegleria lovaniensis]|uniref:Transmembrane protein n=1 Tax=Naegleria lovaniensis TaxID=51637 RepID=A0AA88KIE5_NAELO|nr:uncharacterized protein C9374_005919 [Naegleria lovaniensis]KAG2382127.1 hypothetical protein C9374_005919 [Naegleria lovaniensis]